MYDGAEFGTSTSWEGGITLGEEEFSAMAIHSLVDGFPPE